MRLSPIVIRSIEEVLREVLRFAAPADNTISRYFRENPKLGGRERGAVAESVYAILRNKLVFTHYAESGVGASMRRLALLGLASVYGVEPIPSIDETEKAWLNRVLSITQDNLPLETRINVPVWLWEKLCEQQGAEQAQSLVDALNAPASLDLRVNTLKTHREEVEKQMNQAGIAYTLTPYSDIGLRLKNKPALQNLTVFNEGGIEVQDEGSQLLSLIVGAKRGEMVADFCAGAGGKTLALGAAMRNTGRLYAFDVSEKRLAKLKPRLARSGLSNIHPVVIAHENDTKIKRLAGKMDKVLVDAPCSGLGTLRRNPDMKWRMTEADIQELNVKQLSILQSASRLVRKGGRLVYATCSILREENQSIAEEFLATHTDFQRVPMSGLLQELKIDLAMQEYLQLYPHLHQTDGFFAAVFERKS